MKPVQAEAFKAADGEVYTTYEKARKANIDYYAKKLFEDRYPGGLSPNDEVYAHQLAATVWDTSQQWKKTNVKAALEGLLENLP